ncbi:MAG: hypothetical protein ACK2T2_04885 [Anaerolineales bacterium]
MEQLRESVESKRGPGCLVMFSLLWLSFSSFWTFTAWKSGGGAMALFGLPFIAIGLFLLLGSFWRRIAGVRIGKPKLMASKTTLRPNETFVVRYEQTFRLPIDIQECRVELVFREKATYRRGTDTYTEVHEEVQDFFEAPVGHFDAGQTTQSEGRMTIPAQAMHSFRATNNQLQWLMRVLVNAQGWPDVKDEFELVVLAEGF